MYSEETHQEAARLRVEEGLSAIKIAARLGVSDKIVRLWLKDHPPFTSKEIEVKCPCGVRFRTTEDRHYCSTRCKQNVRNKRDRHNWAQNAQRRKRRSALAFERKLEVFRHYCGGEPRCQCPSGLCHETVVEFLTLDHIDNDGYRERARPNGRQRGAGSATYARLKREGFPPGFRVLCWNCNCARAKMPDKVCPHELLRQQTRINSDSDQNPGY